MILVSTTLGIHMGGHNWSIWLETWSRKTMVVVSMVETARCPTSKGARSSISLSRFTVHHPTSTSRTTTEITSTRLFFEKELCLTAPTTISSTLSFCGQPVTRSMSINLSKNKKQKNKKQKKFKIVF